MRIARAPSPAAVADEDADDDTSRRRLLSRRSLLDLPDAYVDNQQSGVMPDIKLATYTIKVRRPPVPAACYVL